VPQVPTHVTGEQLLSQAPHLAHTFPAASHLRLRGAYARLTPDHVRTFLLASPIAGSTRLTHLSLEAVDLPELPLYLGVVLQLPRRYAG